jgi:hypothetical protein
MLDEVSGDVAPASRAVPDRSQEVISHVAVPPVWPCAPACLVARLQIDTVELVGSDAQLSGDRWLKVPFQLIVVVPRIGLVLDDEGDLLVHDDRDIDRPRLFSPHRPNLFDSDSGFVQQATNEALPELIQRRVFSRVLRISKAREPQQEGILGEFGRGVIE